MTIDEIVTLIQAVSDNGLTSFEYEEGDQKLVLKKKKKKNVVQAAPQIMSPVAMPMQMAAAPAVEMTAPAAATTADAVTAKTDAAAAEHLVGNVVTSPLVGTFYSAGSPENPPFVSVGDTVKKGQVLGIIEAMKLMNEIESEFDGVVEAILVENEAVVEYGQPLFRIR